MRYINSHFTYLLYLPAGAKTGTPRDALAPYPWSGIKNWCLAES